MNRAEEWRKLEEALTNFVGSMSSQLSIRDCALLAEFIDNREFGVALEWLHSSVVEPSASQKLEVQRLAKMMDIDLP
ncbi:hypothetical protein [Bradyrhizobium liaoningense]